MTYTEDVAIKLKKSWWKIRKKQKTSFYLASIYKLFDMYSGH